MKDVVSYRATKTGRILVRHLKDLVFCSFCMRRGPGTCTATGYPAICDNCVVLAKRACRG